MDPLIIFFGLGVGILIGLTGVGGGSLMTPLLLIVGGYSPSVAIGTDLAYGAITKTLGGWQHLRAGNVDLRLSRYLAYGSVPGSVLGVIALELLDNAYGDKFTPYLLSAVAVALALAAAASLYRSLFRPGLIAKERDSAPLQRRVSRRVTTAIGFVLGFILGLTSVGSGALIGLALILLYKLRPRRVVGTDVFHAAVLLWTAALAHLIGGNIDFGLMGTILIGSLPGRPDRHDARPVRAGNRPARHAGSGARGRFAGRLHEGRRGHPGRRDHRRPGSHRRLRLRRCTAATRRRLAKPEPDPAP